MDSTLDSKIRRAVAEGNFSRARGLWEEYAKQCAEEMRRGPDAPGALDQARQLMVWCRQMALAARAQAQAQLDRLTRGSRVAAAYGQSHSPPPGSVRAVRY
jgi:hypothetical protein